MTTPDGGRTARGPDVDGVGSGREAEVAYVALIVLTLFAALVGQATILRRGGRGGVVQASRRNVVLHESLPDELLDRVAHVAGVLAVLGRTPDEYVEELKREAFPLRAWAPWEHVATALEAFAATRPTDDAERREAAMILRLRSMVDEAEVTRSVDPVLLSTDDVRALLAAYARAERRGNEGA